MHDELRERERGDYVAPVDITVRAYLEERWLPALDSEELSPATVVAYELHVGRIVPLIGDVPLQTPDAQRRRPDGGAAGTRGLTDDQAATLRRDARRPAAGPCTAPSMTPWRPVCCAANPAAR